MYRHRQSQQHWRPPVAAPHYPRLAASAAIVSRSTVTEYSISTKPRPVQFAPVLPPPRPPAAAGASRTASSAAVTAAAAVSRRAALARFDFEDDGQEQQQLSRVAHIAKTAVRSSTGNSASSRVRAVQTQQRQRRAAAHVVGSTPSPVRYHARSVKPAAAPIATHVKTLSLSPSARQQQPQQQESREGPRRQPALTPPASPPAVRREPTRGPEPTSTATDASTRWHRKRQADTELEQAAQEAEQQHQQQLEDGSEPTPAARRAPSQKRLRYDAAVALAMQRSPSVSAPRGTRNSQRAAAAPCSPPASASSASATAAVSGTLPTLSSVQENDDYCAVCGHAGRLLCCLRCVQAFHFSCLDMAEFSSISDVPDSWTCADGSRTRCTARTTPRRDSDQPNDDERSAFRWTSKPARRGGSSQSFYSSFRRGLESYRVGDVVAIKTDGSDAVSSSPSVPAERCERVGQLEAAWQDADGERWLQMRWYFLPEETRHGRLPAHHERELFATAHVSEAPVDSIQCKVLLLPERDWRLREERQELDDCTFLCRQRYDHDRGAFRPIIDDGEQAQDGQDAAEDADDWELDGAGGRVRRHHRQEGSDASVFSRACTALQLSSLPASLPCREEEERKIRAFLTSAIRRGGQQGGGLYIAGVPGTGKTATVRQVLAGLSRRTTSDSAVLAADGDAVPDFQFIEVNGMKLPQPAAAYSQIWQAMTGRRVRPSRACALLDARFRSRQSRRPVCVLLIDEIDYCLTRSQHLLYHLSDWPTHRASRLVTVAISNTIDFPTLLHERVRSRFVSQQLVFAPYTAQQVEAIVQARLSAAGSAVFEQDALTLCAKKIANINGDVRVALEICRRAAAIAEERQAAAAPARGRQGSAQSGVSMSIVHRAIEELQGSSEVELLRACSLYERALLAAVYAESREESAWMPLHRAADRLRRSMSNRGGHCQLSQWEVEGVCRALVSVRLLELRRIRGQLTPDVRLTLAPHLCRHALKDDQSWLQMIHQ